MVPLDVEYVANEVGEAILKDEHTRTIPIYLKLMRILQCLPLNIQQSFNNRVKREQNFKNPEFNNLRIIMDWREKKRVGETVTLKMKIITQRTRINSLFRVCES